MRWERLFADLEGQLEATEAGELEAEVADRTRRELATIELVDRLRANVGRNVGLLTPAGLVSGAVVQVGDGWLLVAERGATEGVVPLDAVLAVTGLDTSVAAAASAVESRLRLGYALRAIALRRDEVRLALTSGDLVTGTISRVGADHLEIAEHPLGDATARRAPAGMRVVSFRALAVVRSG